MTLTLKKHQLRASEKIALEDYIVYWGKQGPSQWAGYFSADVINGISNESIWRP
jgi:hypothetical protein